MCEKQKEPNASAPVDLKWDAEKHAFYLDCKTAFGNRWLTCPKCRRGLVQTEPGTAKCFCSQCGKYFGMDGYMYIVPAKIADILVVAESRGDGFDGVVGEIAKAQAYQPPITGIAPKDGQFPGVVTDGLYGAPKGEPATAPKKAGKPPANHIHGALRELYDGLSLRHDLAMDPEEDPRHSLACVVSRIKCAVEHLEMHLIENGLNEQER